MARGFKTAYGLDVSAGRLVLARCGRRGAPQVALAAAADSDEALRAVQTATAEAAQGAAALAVAAPAALTAVRRLRAPFASVRKAAKVWPALLDVDLPFPVESAACFYGAPRVENGGTAALAAALRRSDLEALLETCRAAGADPTHCDAEALALWSQHLAEAPPARVDGVRALVWLGAEHVVVARGRGSEFMAAHVLRASPLADPQAFAALWASRARQILAVHLAEEPREADEREIRGVEHDLEREEHDQWAAAQQHPGDADREEQRGDREVPGDPGAGHRASSSAADRIPSTTPPAKATPGIAKSRVSTCAADSNIPRRRPSLRAAGLTACRTRRCEGRRRSGSSCPRRRFCASPLPRGR